MLLVINQQNRSSKIIRNNLQSGDVSLDVRIVCDQSVNGSTLKCLASREIIFDTGLSPIWDCFSQKKMITT